MCLWLDYKLSSVWKAVKKKSVARVHLWRENFMWYLEYVIQWDCYSSCVKIHCRETASGDCNTLRILVCAWQWSVKCSHESWVYKWSINLVTNPNPTYSHPYMWQYILKHLKITRFQGKQTASVYILIYCDGPLPSNERLFTDVISTVTNTENYPITCNS
jgi:hypothetical protein